MQSKRQSDKQSKKLGIGEYEWRVGVAPSKEQARELFLQAVNNVEPQVLQDLKDGPFVIFRRIHYPEGQRRREPAADALPRSLATWQSRWHLDEQWCFDRALQTLAWWCHSSKEAGKKWNPTRGALRVAAVTEAERQSEFTDVGWDPATERRQDARERMLSDFQQKLDAYLTNVEQLVLTRSVIDASVAGKSTKLSTLRQAPSKRERDHFVWLARFQVQGWSHERIGEKYGRGRKSVADGVKKSAELIGLTLRPAAKTGRPAGSKDSRRRHLARR